MRMFQQLLQLLLLLQLARPIQAVCRFLGNQPT